MTLRLPLLSRLSWVGVIAFGVGITVFGIWSTWYTLAAIDDTKRVVTLNDAWKQARFWIAEEETLERKYRIERDPVGKRYHSEVVGILDRTVRHLRPISTAADNARIDKLLADNAAYARAMQAMFAAVDAGDERRIERIHDQVDPTYDEIEHIANMQELQYHRAAYLAFARLEKTQRFVATGFPILAAIGGVAILAFGWVIREYRRRTDRVIATQLERLEAAALADSLTGLRNSRAFQSDIDAYATAARAPLHLALADVDHFKQANDRFGHLHGDNVLRTLGAILAELAEGATAYRIGGDEFAIAFAGISFDAAVGMMRAVQIQCAARMRGNTLSIGIATQTDDEPDIGALRERADIALYEAKHGGRNRIVVFDAQLLETSTSLGARRLALERILDHPDTIDVVFQPIWRFDGGALLGYEALARFRSDFATPDEAFAVAERLERTHELDARCLAAVAAHVPANFSGTLFVNLAPTTLLHGGVAAAALEALSRGTGLPPEAIVVELTEHLPILPPAIQRVRELRASGYRFALDDTGSGNAGLAILAKLPLDVVKIDKTLLTSIDVDSRTQAIVGGILVMVKGLGCSVVVEGVETREHIRSCSKLAMEFGVGAQLSLQGYGLGRPGAAADMDVSPVHPALRHAGASHFGRDRRSDSLSA